jgi:hypothetical protein
VFRYCGGASSCHACAPPTPIAIPTTSSATPHLVDLDIAIPFLSGYEPMDVVRDRGACVLLCY